MQHIYHFALNPSTEAKGAGRNDYFSILILIYMKLNLTELVDFI